MIKGLLTKIGLSDKDADVYLACLELGTQPASIIARKAHLKRPTTYLILEALVRRGLVSEFSGSNVKYFSAVNPEYLLTYVERQKRELTSHQREIESLLPHMQSLSNPMSVSPKVRFFEGFDGVERVMSDTLTSTETLRGFVNIDAWFSKPQLKDFIIWYGQQRVHHRKIPINFLASDTPMAREYLEKDYPSIEDHKMSHFRWLGADIPALSNEINIYDNKVAIVSISQRELLGILIESESIARSQKAIFEAAWRTSQRAKWETPDMPNTSLFR